MDDLSALERSKHTARRKEVYEAINQWATVEAKKQAGGKLGGKIAGRGRPKDAQAPETISPAYNQDTPTFVQDTAAKTGLTERTIQQDVQIGKNIPEDVRDSIKDTPLAEQHQREILAHLEAMQPLVERQAEMTRAWHDQAAEAYGRVLQADDPASEQRSSLRAERDGALAVLEAAKMAHSEAMAATFRLELRLAHCRRALSASSTHRHAVV